MFICLERGADLHMAQLMPLPLTVSCFSKIQIGFTFLIPAHPGSPGQGLVKRVCVYWCNLAAGTVYDDCQVWDLRKNDVLYRMYGHADTVTGTELSPDGSYLLTTAMDNTGWFQLHCLTRNSFAEWVACWTQAQ